MIDPCVPMGVDLYIPLGRSETSREDDVARRAQ